MTQLDLKKLREVAEAANKIDPRAENDTAHLMEASLATGTFLSTFNPALILQLLDLAERRWIPVSERMPTRGDGDSSGEVLALWKDDLGCSVMHYLDVELCKYKQVSHWQTLPDPPEAK